MRKKDRQTDMTFNLPAPLRRFRQRVLFRLPNGAPVTGRVLFDAGLILLGSIFMALSVNIFLNPNDVVPGGFTALAMFANRLWGWPIGLTLLALNFPFLIIGMRVLGLQFGPKTIAAAATSALLIDLLEPYLPVVKGEPLLYTLYGGLLYGFGMALVFRANATTGGTEIPAKLLEHFRGIRMSQSLLAMDLVILLLAAIYFGLAPALYALIAAWVMARVIDAVESGFESGNTAFIVTKYPELVRDSIMIDLGRGVTVLQATGGYTGEHRTLLFTAINGRQTPELRDIVRSADPDAFVVISPSHEVLGEGFRPLTRVSRS
ncbi:MAG: YitT family protein [Anaerolineae bacterium]|nr:YitT family protein [Anaerolineae bacterium]